MKILKYKFIPFIFIFLLGIYPSILYAFDETIALPEACEKKLTGASSKKLKAIQFNAYKSVLKLAETKKLAAYIQANTGNLAPNTKIVYTSDLAEKEVSNQQQCFSEISVYINNEEIMHSWHVFLVDLKGITRFVMYLPDGDYITLKQWRKKSDLDGQDALLQLR